MRSHPLFMTVWLATGALIGLLPVAIGTYFVMQQAYKIAVYPPTPTIILDWGNRRHEGFRLKARYEYMAGNKRHISTQAFSTPRWGDDDTWGDVGAANEVEALFRYRPGQQAMAFYNPAAPGDAFLLRDDLYGYCGCLYFGWPVLTFVVAVWMSVAPEVKLAGTLLIPAHKFGAKVPGVIIVARSGPTDRDGNSALLGVKINLLKQIAGQLAEAGIASLRYDKRGQYCSGEPPKDQESLFAFTRWENYVGDAAATLTYLQEQVEIDAGRTAMIGHSEGGMLILQGAVEGKFFAKETAALSAGLKKRQPDDHEVYIAPGASHYLKPVKSDNDHGFGGDLAPEAAAKLRSWLAKKLGSAATK